MGLCEVIACDADPAACEVLTEQLGPLHRVLPVAVADGMDHTLHVCKMASRSSLFPPNLALCSRYQAFAEGSEVVESHTVSTVKLDDLGLDSVDFVKMDIQGAELMAIENGTSLLAKALVVEVEVEFVEQYIGQPLFGEIDASLRKLGFMFHSFLGFGTRNLKPMVVNNDPLRGINQWLWADAIYLVDFSRLDNLGNDRLIKLAMLAHALYGSWDVALDCFRRFDDINGTSCASSYLNILNPFDE
jgi:FkbM family methyltransferase